MRARSVMVTALVAVATIGACAAPRSLAPSGTLADVRSGRLVVTESGLSRTSSSSGRRQGAAADDQRRQRRTGAPTTTAAAAAAAKAAAAKAAADAARPAGHGPPANSVWRPATPEQQRDSLKGAVAPQQGPVHGGAAAAAPLAGQAGAAAAAAAPAAMASPAAMLAAAVELGSDATLFSDEEEDGAGLLVDAAYEASAGAPTLDAAASAAAQRADAQRADAQRADAPSPPPRRPSSSRPNQSRPSRPPRSANAPRGPRLASGGGGGGAGRRSLRQFGGGLPPTTSASRAPPVKVGACGLAELSGGSRVASPEAEGTGRFGWSLAVSKDADVMVVGQPGVSLDTGFYADFVQGYEDGTVGAAFVFAAVPGGGAAVALHFARSCMFADQRLVNPVWRVEKEVVGFGSEVAVSFKGDVALASGRLIPNPSSPEDDDDGGGGGGADESTYSTEDNDMVWAFKRGVTGYVQFSRQEMPLINPPVGDEQFSDDQVLRRVMAVGLSFDGGLAMAAYLSVEKDNPTVALADVGGSVQIFGSTKERYLLTQVIGPPKGSRAQSWAVAAAMSADSGTIVASDGSGQSTLYEDGSLFDDGVYLEDGSGVFVFARTDGLAVTKPDGKAGLVQSNATARYTLAGLLRPPLWTEDIRPDKHDATATFGTAVAVTAKAKFVAVVERRYVASATADTDDPGESGFWAVAHFVHVYQRVDGTGKGLTAMYALKCTLDDPDPHRYSPFGYGRHQLSVATDGKFATVAIGSQPSTQQGPQRDLPNSVYVYRIVAGQTAGKGEDICPFEPEFVVDDPRFAGGGGDDDGAQPSLFGEAVALTANGRVLVVGAPETAVRGEDGSVYLYDLRKPVKKDVYVGNAPLVGVSR